MTKITTIKKDPDVASTVATGVDFTITDIEVAPRSYKNVDNHSIPKIIKMLEKGWIHHDELSPEKFKEVLEYLKKNFKEAKIDKNIIDKKRRLDFDEVK